MDVTPAAILADGPDVGQIDRATLEPYAFASPPGDDTFFVAITDGARRAMEAHAHSRLDVEVGGVLLGRLYRPLGEDRAALLIDAVVPGLAAESKDTNLTFTAGAWTQIHATIDRDHPGASIVGWYHTHPNFGIFLSEMDVFIQRHFFDLPHHVAIVIDPVRKEDGIFTWQRGVPVRSPIYAETAPPDVGDVASATGGSSAADAPPVDLTGLMRRRHQAGELLHAKARPMRTVLRGFRSLWGELRDLDVAQRIALALLLTLVAIIFCAIGYVASGPRHPAPSFDTDLPTETR